LHCCWSCCRGRIRPEHARCKWRTIDDKTGKVKSIVAIYETTRTATLAGKVLQVLDSGRDRNARDAMPARAPTTTTDHRMVIAWAFATKARRGPTARSSTPRTARLLGQDDAEDDGRKLQSVGYIAFQLLGRSQTWVREALRPP